MLMYLSFINTELDFKDSQELYFWMSSQCLFLLMTFFFFLLIGFI